AVLQHDMEEPAQAADGRQGADPGAGGASHLHVRPARGVEVRELQRQLDHSLKLEEFLRTKGTVRLTAADAKAEAKRLEQQEAEMRAYNNYVNILDAIREFTRREEENYALFNYINEVCSELKNLSDNVSTLSVNIDEENVKHQAKLHQQQDTIESLTATLEEKTARSAAAGDLARRSAHLLGKAFEINVTNARLYIKSLEKKIVEIVDILKIDE
ncbi:putative nuclear lamin L1 alpha, partial [Operophtera brumata]